MTSHERRVQREIKECQATLERAGLTVGQELTWEEFEALSPAAVKAQSRLWYLGCHLAHPDQYPL